jgi:hypothetical protein
VLFIGTQFSILYTSMYSPAEAATLNKYTRQGAQDGGPAAYLCTYLDNHGVKPEKVLKKDGLAGADWDDPASVNTLYVASTKFWPRTVGSDSDADAYSDADDYAAGAAASDDSD